MPRAAFSQIVNRSMSEVLTRSIATTSCTLLPVIALLLFGGSTLQDFAFALLIGVASGAYSSIFIASPVLTHWKEREPTYRHRRHRIETEYGFVAPYASSAADVEPARERVRRRAGRLTEPSPDEGVSAAEFEQMKRDIAEEEAEPSARTSTLTKRLSHTPESKTPAPARRGRSSKPRPAATAPGSPAPAPPPQPAAPNQPGAATPEQTDPEQAPAQPGNGEFQHAPDLAEDGGVSPVSKPPRPAKSRSRNRRHGRPR